MGVGIYNAVQLNRVNRQVSEMRQELAFGFGTVEAMLGRQARTLEILLKENRAIADALRALRAEMHQGFTNVNARFDQQEADAFHRHTLKLLQVWRRVGEEMVVEAVAPDELSRLVAAADELDSWASVSAAKIQAGHPARQPFFIARALSLRAVADAKLLQSEKIGRVAEERLHDFVSEVATEASALCSGQTTYFLAVEVPEILAQYAYLRRGLTVAGNLKADAWLRRTDHFPGPTTLNTSRQCSRDRTQQPRTKRSSPEKLRSHSFPSSPALLKRIRREGR